MSWTLPAVKDSFAPSSARFRAYAESLDASSTTATSPSTAICPFVSAVSLSYWKQMLAPSSTRRRFAPTTWSATFTSFVRRNSPFTAMA